MNKPVYLSDLLDWDSLESYEDWLYKKEDEEIPDEEPETFLE